MPCFTTCKWLCRERHQMRVSTSHLWQTPVVDVWYWYCLRIPWNLIDKFIDKVHDAEHHYHVSSYREAAEVKLSPFYQRWTWQHSFSNQQSVFGLSHRSKGRKGFLKHVCEITKNSKGYSRANIAPETTCNSHFAPEEVVLVGSVPLTELTPQSKQQQQIFADSNKSVTIQRHSELWRMQACYFQCLFWNSSLFNTIPFQSHVSQGTLCLDSFWSHNSPHSD